MLIIILRYSPSNPTWMRVFSWIDVKIYQMLFCVCWDAHVIFFLLLLMLWCTTLIEEICSFYLFLYFYKRHAACGILVPWAAIKSMPLHWKWGVTNESWGKFWEILLLLFLQYKLQLASDRCYVVKSHIPFWALYLSLHFLITSNLFGDTMHRSEI